MYPRSSGIVTSVPARAEISNATENGHPEVARQLSSFKQTAFDTFVATPKLAKGLKSNFPNSLDGAPMLLPVENTAARRTLHYWFDSQGVQPRITGEFQDHALLRAFGQAGIGVFPIPSVFEKQIAQQGTLQRIGRTEDVRNRFYAISVERKLKHPGVLAICDTARKLFA